MSAPAATQAADRARLRAEVAHAARVLAPTWPIETFVAVNPLGGLEDRPFEDAVEVAGRVLGARGTLPEPAFREAWAGGRVTDADLLGALARRHPAVLAAGELALGGTTVPAADVVLCDLLHGDPAPPPRRTVRTRAEAEAPEVAAAVDAQAAKWLAAFLDAGQAGWAMPRREQGFWAAWRALAPRDRTVSRAVRRALAALPERADDAVLGALAALGVHGAERRSLLQAHLTRLPGWAAHVRWRAEREGGIDLVDLLAVRLSYEVALLAEAPAAPQRAPQAPAPRPASPDERARRVAEVLGAGASEAELAAVAALLERVPVADRAFVWLDAYEAHVRDALLDALSGPPAAPAAPRPAAQLVCCIDVRSEGLRRHVEATGPYETLGFAGFFAVAIRFQDLSGGAPSDLCPVLLEPRNAVRERPAPGAQAQAERRLAGHRALSGAEDAWHAAEARAGAPLALAEATGWAAGPLAAVRTLVPGAWGAVRDGAARRAAPPAPTVLGVQEAFGADERALFAEAALTMMGLTERFGRLVVLCGHGSRTENNPYEAALACGACGGNAGGPNARTAAAVLNGADVREHLAGRGIVVPQDTWFVAGEHDTTTDRVELLDRHLVPASHHEELDRLAADLRTAGARLSAERAAELPGAPRDAGRRRAARHVRARSADWAQAFPEWGLAGNAAFVVAPRSVTRGVDLGRRCFLHSYEAAADPDGAALETILTAPLVVAHWISSQYLFSTVDPVVLGAGTKAVHNVVGAIGVLAGPGGDLQLGLPWQSVADGERLVHEPVRLLAVVQAPLARIDAIVARNAVLRDLFGGGWVALAGREAPGEAWLRRTAEGWRPWRREEVAAACATRG
jgi:hypothetical protein